MFNQLSIRQLPYHARLRTMHDRPRLIINGHNTDFEANAADLLSQYTSVKISDEPFRGATEVSQDHSYGDGHYWSVQSLRIWLCDTKLYGIAGISSYDTRKFYVKFGRKSRAKKVPIERIY